MWSKLSIHFTNKILRELDNKKVLFPGCQTCVCKRGITESFIKAAMYTLQKFIEMITLQKLRSNRLGASCTKLHLKTSPSGYINSAPIGKATYLLVSSLWHTLFCLMRAD